MKQIAYMCIFFSFLFTACNEDDEGANIDINLGYTYAPLRLQQESIFQIDSIKYDDFTGRVDTFRHQRRELVELEIVDAAGRQAYELGVYERANDTGSWRKVKVIRKTRTERRFEVLEDNVVRLDLIFPIRDEVQWNVNALNSNNELEYTYMDAHRPFQLEGVNYDSTVTVQQIDEENLIERKFSEEKYSAGSGLIYKRAIDLELEADGTIISGFDATLRLISFQE